MGTLNIEGLGAFTVDDSFGKLPQAEQQKYVDEIRQQYAAKNVAADIANSAKNYSSMSGGELAKETASNILPSAGRFAESVVQPILHPVHTFNELRALGKGVMQKLGVISGKDAEQYADAVGKMLVDRYGSKDAILKTLVTDPVGIMADVSTVLSAGGSLAVRAPGLVSRVGEAAQTAGRLTNPLSAVAPVARAGGRLASDVLGVTTGAGGEAIRTAAQAGAEGGEAASAFRQHLTGEVAAEDVVSDARAAVANLRQQRGDIYREDMANLAESKKVLDFDKIDESVDRVQNIKNFKGIDTQRSAAAVRGKITEVVNEWKNLDSKEFHTAEGLDALKQTIGDLRDDTQPGTSSRRVADDVYHAIRQTIVDEFPKYGETMRGYEKATAEIKEIEKTLSTNAKASIDTALRKITSALRDNVNTNYGKRKELVGFLARSGATHLLQKIAGQALKSAVPRGLGQAVAGGESLAALSALALGNPLIAAKLGATLTATSPRLVGEAAFRAGQATRLPLRQAGLGSRIIGGAGRLGSQQ
jgi:hypothetical protein